MPDEPKPRMTAGRIAALVTLALLLTFIVVKLGLVRY